ncbi:hypothetical protein I4U23_030068 [Adineta vaga]|nr:hypothetical protein I4U23_030068 [Adineta vaga]
MFLNDLSIYSIPVIGIIVLVIVIQSSKTISLFKNQLSTKSKKQQSHINHLPNHICDFDMAIQVNNVDSYQLQSTALLLDDEDEELIKSDSSSISVTNFCDNSSIELCLDQDPDYDDDDDDDDDDNH